jgi:hypothetical protein
LRLFLPLLPAGAVRVSTSATAHRVAKLATHRIGRIIGDAADIPLGSFC